MPEGPKNWGEMTEEKNAELESKILTYKESWLRVLKNKFVCGSEISNKDLRNRIFTVLNKLAGFTLMPTKRQNITTMSLLPRTSGKTDEKGDNAESNQPPHGIINLTHRLAQYLEDNPLSSYSPDSIQVILFPPDLSNDLFPNDGWSDSRLGQHKRRGGYSAAFLPIDNEGRIYPFVLGHEIGEIIFTNLLSANDTDGQIRKDVFDHPLREGFCNVVGMDFMNFYAKSSTGKSAVNSYEHLSGQILRDYDLERILGDTSLSFLSSEERNFAEYRLGGCIADALQRKYGLARLIDYFNREAKKYIAKELDTMAKLREKFGPVSDTLFMTGTEFGTTRVTHSALNELLRVLGYDEEQFQYIGNRSVAPDNRPEGAIACTMIDQFQAWTISADQTNCSLDNRPIRDDNEGASFIQTVISGMDLKCAKGAFGDNFYPQEFVITWKQHMLATYT